MSIPRATTPTLALTFSKDDLDLTTAQNVYVTLEQGEKSLTKSGSVINVTANRIEIFLSQSETLKFAEGDVKIQANWTAEGGGRAASAVKTINMSEQLLRKVVE